MKIGLIGVGAIGGAFAGHLARAGHELLLSNSRGADALTDLVRSLGSRARPAEREEAAQADLVILAVPWAQVPAALASVPAWNCLLYTSDAADE